MTVCAAGRCTTKFLPSLLSTCADITPQYSLAMQDSEDIRYMVGALKDLGIKLEEDWQNDKILVHGCGGNFPVEHAELFLGNAGTAMR